MPAYNQSKIKSFRRCQKQFSFRHDYAPEGKELVPRVPSVPLSRGTWMHALQEAHHLSWAGDRIADWEKTHEKLTAEFNKLFDEEKADRGDLPAECERLFRAYLRFWRDDADNYTVAKLDHRGPDGIRVRGPAVEFVVEVSLERWGISEPFKGRIDLLVTDGEYGGLWIWDAKWVKSLPKPDESMMSPQALMYVWALRKMGYPILGFVYNRGRTKAPTIPYVLKDGTVTTRKNIDTDLYTYLSTVKKVHGKKWKVYARTHYKEKIRDLRGRDKFWFQRERVPVETPRIRRALGEFLASIRDIERRTTGRHVPRTYNFMCKRDCDYHELCVTEFTGLDIQPLIKKRFEIVEERYAEEQEEEFVAG